MLSKADLESTEQLGHFNKFLGTYWPSVKLKPPSKKDKLGWRVEFRPCELQFNDFENAALGQHVGQERLTHHVLVPTNRWRIPTPIFGVRPAL